MGTHQLRTWLVMVLSALVVYSASDIFMPSISPMAEDLGVSEAVATTNLSSYYLVLMLSYLTVGPLCDSMDKKRLLMMSIGGCLLGCILCATASDMLVMNIGRGCQALATGLVLLTTQVWIASFSSKNEMLGRYAWFSLVTALAPVLAPAVGGLITDLLSWRYNFWFIAVLCVVAAIALIGTDIAHPADTPEGQGNWRGYVKKTAEGYWWALVHSPVEQLTLTIQGLFLGQGAFFAVASFLFIREFGVSAGSLGMLSTITVAGLLAGRFFTMYLRKHYSNRCVFLLNSAIVIVSAIAVLCYYFVTGSHNAVEVIAGMSLQAVGFGGLAILSLNNSMLVAGDRKGIISGVYNFMNQGASLAGILLVQLFFGVGFSGMQIFQIIIYVVLLLSIIGTVLFIRAYPKCKEAIE